MNIKRQIKPDFHEGVDRKDLKILSQRFLSLVKTRLERTKLAMTGRQQMVVDLLPLLFHVNHPLLPGYISRQAPHLVRNYAPDKDTVRRAQSLTRSFNYRSSENKTADIVSLFLMGSTGSIAHSGTSDLDIWLCYRNGLANKAVAELERKAQAVSGWAEDVGVETHIFLMNAASFRQGRETALADSEDCGTAQHYLLLDEFYRTSIWLAGAYPLWWLIPADQEHNYNELARLLLEKRFIKSRDYIDFGGCATIPPNEFVGAGMWQLYKGIDSPFKSALKLKLVESYVKEEKKLPPLCHDFKRAVFDDDIDPDELDPYVMIYRRLESSLTARRELHKLELVRRAFYLKVGEKLSRVVKTHERGWRRRFMEKLLQEWGWEDAEVKYLDARQFWKIEQVLQERRLIVNELTESYRYLSGYARDNGLAAAISKRDINLLGRKLYAAFQRKAGKIEMINPNISPNLAEDSISFHHLSSQALSSGVNGWLLYTNLSTPADADYSPAQKRSNSLIELVVWAYVNGLLAGTSSVSLVAGESAATVFELQQIMGSMRSLIPLPMPEVSQQAYHDKAKLRMVMLFVNVGVDPMTNLTKRGLSKLSDHTDALGYASTRSNLVVTLDKVMVNSWNEVMVQRYESGDTLVQCLNNTLAALAESGQYGAHLPGFSVFCFCPTRPAAIARRVHQLFKQVAGCFFSKPATSGHFDHKRYLLQIEERYFILQFEASRPRFTSVDSYDELCDYLSLPQSHFSAMEVDEYALIGDPLIPIFKRMQPDTVKVFAYHEKLGYWLYVVDECGSLVRFANTGEDRRLLLGALRTFLYSVQERKQMRDTLDASQDIIADVEFYQLQQAGKQYKVDGLAILSQQGAGEYIEIQAIGHMDIGGNLRFSLFCEHQEFSPMDYGDKVEEALAHYIQQRFTNADLIPCYITDVSIPHSLVQDTFQLQTSLYLTYKNELETRLHQARFGYRSNSESLAPDSGRQTLGTESNAENTGS